MITKIKELKNHQGFKKYFTNTSWLLGEKLLRMVIGLFVGIWVARYLGPEQFGLFNYALSFAGLFTAISGLGLDRIIIRELVADESKRDDLFGTAFRLKLLGALLVLIILAIAVKLSNQDSLTTLLIFIIASATIFQSFNVIDFYFQSKVLSRYVVFANMISLFISSVIKVALILDEAPLIYFAYVVLFESLVLSGGLIYFYLKEKKPLKIWDFDIRLAINLLKDSWPLILVGIASTLNMRIDQVMLGSMLDNETVGNYAAGVKVAELWLVLPVLIGSSIYPAIIRAKETSDSLYRERIFKTIKYMSSFAIPFAIIISLLSESIINILYGKEYIDAAMYLNFYIWTGLPYVIFFIFGQVFIIENILKFNLYITVFVTVTNLGLNFLLIPKYGGLGAVTATLVAAYGGQLISIIIIKNKTRIFINN